MTQCKPRYSARIQARSMVHDHLLEVAGVCRKAAEETEAVNRANGFAHIAPDVLRERAIAYEEFANILRAEIESAQGGGE